MTQTSIVAVCLFLGFALGWLANDYLVRKRRKILSNWEPGMVITMGDGERLYVCAVEDREP